MKHSTQKSSGSSGSAIINKDFEIIGINIGRSGLKIFNKDFPITGHAIPTGIISEFMERIQEIKNN